MKTEAEIAHKLKQVQFRHAKREIADLLDTKPSNCAHNRQLDLAGFGKIGFCSSQDCPRKGKSCDSRFSDRAVGCAFYEPLHNADDARSRVKEFFKNAPPSEIAAKYSDVAALIWALDEERVEYPDPYSAGELEGISIWVADLDDADALKTILRDLEEARESLEGDLADLHTRLGARDEEVASLEIRLSEATNQVTSKQAEADSLKAEVTRLSVPKPNALMTWLRPMALVFTAFIDRIWKKP